MFTVVSRILRPFLLNPGEYPMKLITYLQVKNSNFVPLGGLRLLTLGGSFEFLTEFRYSFILRVSEVHGRDATESMEIQSGNAACVLVTVPVARSTIF